MGKGPSNTLLEQKASNLALGLSGTRKGVVAVFTMLHNREVRQRDPSLEGMARSLFCHRNTITRPIRGRPQRLRISLVERWRVMERAATLRKLLAAVPLIEYSAEHCQEMQARLATIFPTIRRT
jgi:hypothetical protein